MTLTPNNPQPVTQDFQPQVTLKIQSAGIWHMSDFAGNKIQSGDQNEARPEYIKVLLEKLL